MPVNPPPKPRRPAYNIAEEKVPVALQTGEPRPVPYRKPSGPVYTPLSLPPGGRDDPEAVREAERSTDRESRLLADRHAQPPPLPQARVPMPSNHEFDEIVRDQRKVRGLIDEVEGKVDRRIDRLEHKTDLQFQDLKIQLANVGSKVTNAQASASSDTVKIIVGGLVTCVLSIVGAVGGNHVLNKPEPTRVEVIKSQSELESEICEKKPTPEEKGTCYAGVLTRLVAPQKR